MDNDAVTYNYYIKFSEIPCSKSRWWCARPYHREKKIAVTFGYLATGNSCEDFELILLYLFQHFISFIPEQIPKIAHIEQINRLKIVR